MKRLPSFFAGALTMLLVMSMVVGASAYTGKITKELEYRDIKVTLDGVELDLRDVQGNSVEPFIISGTNYLPVRALSEALGLTVSWDGSTNTVVLQSAETVQREAFEALNGWLAKNYTFLQDNWCPVYQETDSEGFRYSVQYGMEEIILMQSFTESGYSYVLLMAIPREAQDINVQFSVFRATSPSSPIFTGSNTIAASDFSDEMELVFEDMTGDRSGLVHLRGIAKAMALDMVDYLDFMLRTNCSASAEAFGFN